ncbi:MAG: hypothetical protein K6E10_07335 [Eubacterium sp.]|nr:hypothetical protein [Eubacterium sp.]
MKMCIAPGVYSDMIEDKEFGKLLKKVARKKPVATGLFVVTKPLYEAGIMEIYDYNELLQPFYRKKKIKLNIIGISSSRQGAKEIVKNIIDDMYDSLGTIDVTGFFKLG